MWQFVWQLAGVLIGGLITWWVSRHYYKKAGDELKVEVGQVRKINDLILRVLEQKGWAEVARDEGGNVVGFRLLEAVVSDQISVKDAAVGEVVDKKVDDSKPSE